MSGGVQDLEVERPRVAFEDESEYLREPAGTPEPECVGDHTDTYQAESAASHHETVRGERATGMGLS